MHACRAQILTFGTTVIHLDRVEETVSSSRLVNVLSEFIGIGNRDFSVIPVYSLLERG